METMNFNTITVEPELDAFLPELEAEDLDKLKKDIKQNGLRDPLVVWKTTGENDEEKHILLDGHNRMRILKQLKKHEAPVITLKFKDRTDAKSWMLTNQLSRRNLDVFTRVRLVLAFEDEIKRQALDRKKKGQFGADPDSQNSDEPVSEKGTVLEILAKKACTSKDTVYKIKLIMAFPRLMELVGAGQLSINSAAEIAKMPLEEQENAINRALSFGKAEKWEQVEDKEPGYDGGCKTFKIRKSIVKFAVKEDGQPDRRDFLVGDDTLSGVCVRFTNGELKLVQVPEALTNFTSGNQFFYEDAMFHLKHLQNHLVVANDILKAEETVEKAKKKVSAKAKKKEKPVEAVAQPAPEKPAKAKAKKKKKAKTPAKKISKSTLVLMDMKKNIENMLTNTTDEAKKAELIAEIAELDAQLKKSAKPSTKKPVVIDSNNEQEQKAGAENETVPTLQIEEV